MKIVHRLGVVSLSLAAAGVLFAQAPPPANPATTPDRVAHSEFNSVDANRDGRVSREEAQSHAELVSSFSTLDADKDTYLSQNEFAKWHQNGKDMKDKGMKDKGMNPVPNANTPKSEPTIQ